MSLFYCIDVIDDELLKLKRSRWLPRLPREFSKEDEKFLLALKNMLEGRIKNDNYEELDTEINTILDYSVPNPRLVKNRCLKLIVKDLISMKFKKVRTSNSRSSNPDYLKFQQAHYLIAELDQGRLYKLGDSKGECYGFTHAMADSNISPYNPDNIGKPVDLTQKIYDYQKNQLDRKKDQETIQRTRLTREYFCPDYAKQAEKIWQFAENNNGKDLHLSRRDKSKRHSSYACKQENGLRYADPNHGVYFFATKEDFIAFYVAAGKVDKNVGLDYHFYRFDEMKYFAEPQLIKDSNTFRGKLRSFMTGNKYNDGIVISRVTGATDMTTNVIIGAVIGAAIGTVVPVIGTIIGAEIGALIGQGLTILARRNGHGGVLGVPHLLRDTWHNVKESVFNFFHPTPKKEESMPVVSNKQCNDNSPERSASLSGPELGDTTKELIQQMYKPFDEQHGELPIRETPNNPQVSSQEQSLNNGPETPVSTQELFKNNAGVQIPEEKEEELSQGISAKETGLLNKIQI